MTNITNSKLMNDNYNKLNKNNIFNIYSTISNIIWNQNLMTQKKFILIML